MCISKLSDATIQPKLFVCCIVVYVTIHMLRKFDHMFNSTKREKIDKAVQSIAFEMVKLNGMDAALPLSLCDLINGKENGNRA